MQKTATGRGFPGRFVKATQIIYLPESLIYNAKLRSDKFFPAAVDLPTKTIDLRFETAIGQGLPSRFGRIKQWIY